MFTKKLKLKKIGFLILLAFVCFYSAQASTFYYKELSGVVSGSEVEPFYYTAPSDVQLSFSNETVSINQGNSENISYSLTGDQANEVTLSISSSNESIISNSDISLDITNSQVSIPSSATNTKGSTTITLTATDVKGNVIVTDSVSISILGLDGEYQLTLWTVNAGETVSFPFGSPFSSTYSGNIDWGDGSAIEPFSNVKIQSLSHTYVDSGTYEIKIDGDFCDETSFYGMFFDSTIPTGFDISNWNVNHVSNMNGTFYSIHGLTSLDLSGWDVSNVTLMNGMFMDANNLTSLDLSTWDVSNVTSMKSMFDSASSLTNLDLSGWNTSSVTNIENMFSYNFSVNITYDTVVSSSIYSNFLQLLVNPEVSLPNSTTNQEVIAGNNACDISDADCLNAKDTLESKGWTVSDATPLVIDESTALDTRWTVSAGETVTFPCQNNYIGIIDWGDGTIEEYSDLRLASHTYENAGTYTILMNGNWGTNLAHMFHGKDIPNGFDISNWNVSNITDMSYMFYGITIPAGFDISSWDISNVMDMRSMFAASMIPDNFSFNGWDVLPSLYTDTSMLASLFLGDLVYDETVSSATYSKFVQLLVDGGLSVASMGQRLYVGNNTCPVDDTACSSAEATLVSTDNTGDTPGKSWTIVRTTAE